MILIHNLYTSSRLLESFYILLQMKKNLAQGAEFQRPSSSPTPVPRPKKETDLRFVDVKAKFRLPVFTFYFSGYQTASYPNVACRQNAHTILYLFGIKIIAHFHF